MQGPPIRAARPIYHLLAVSCAVLLLAMMALTVADVLGRYLLNMPVRGAAELIELLLAATIFLGLPAAVLDREHVCVDLLTGNLPNAVERLRGPLVLLVSAFVLSLIAWRLWVAAVQIGSYGGTTASLHIPVAPVGYFASLMAGLSAVILAAQTYRSLTTKA